MKLCSICNIVKNESEFFHKNGKIATNFCKKCTGLKYKNKRNEYRNAHKDKVKKWKQKDYNNNRKQAMYSNAKRRSINNNLPFDITIENIVFPEVCPILSIPIVIECGKGVRNYGSPSIDRIDNTKGYTKDNTRIISDRANVLKSDSTQEERIKIYEFYKDKMKANSEFNNTSLPAMP